MYPMTKKNMMIPHHQKDDVTYSSKFGMWMFVHSCAEISENPIITVSA